MNPTPPKEDTRFFGSETQKSIMRRGADMFALVGHEPRFSYYGRTVGVATPTDGTVRDVARLVRLQGNSNVSNVPADDAAGISKELQAEGLSPSAYVKWDGQEAALEAAREAQAHPLPSDISVIRLDADTPHEVLASMADMASAQEVAPPSGATLRGQVGSRPSVCLVACDAGGRVVSVAAASAILDRAHSRFGGQAWWGMLATHPDRRGQGLARVLGARAMLAMAADYGYRDFFTGIVPGNAPSEKLCRGMGLRETGLAIVTCADPTVLKGGRMTK